MVRGALCRGILNETSLACEAFSFWVIGAGLGSGAVRISLLGFAGVGAAVEKKKILL